MNLTLREIGSDLESRAHFQYVTWPSMDRYVETDVDCLSTEPREVLARRYERRAFAAAAVAL